jgi:hypothetical protein
VILLSLLHSFSVQQVRSAETHLSPTSLHQAQPTCNCSRGLYKPVFKSFFRFQLLNRSLDWQNPVLLVPNSSQIRLFSAPNQVNTISRALTVFLSRRASSSRFHRRHSNKSSSKPPTSAIKVNLKKLAPAFRSLCLFPRWLLLPGESTSSRRVTKPPSSLTCFESPVDEATPTRPGTYLP